MKYTHFCYGPNGGFELYETYEEAVKGAEEELDIERDQAGDGWSDEVSNVCVGRLTHHTVQADKKDAPEGSDLDYICDYKLQPIPAAPFAQSN
jgi:hypothetical protein